jgi:hypothetical protein
LMRCRAGRHCNTSQRSLILKDIFLMLFEARRWGEGVLP